MATEMFVQDLAGTAAATATATIGLALVDIAVPVHDEERDLERSVQRLHDHRRHPAHRAGGC
jgi:hypothetical protein